MSRIAIPSSIDQAPAAARANLAKVEKQFGTIPNLFRLAATSPVALEGYLGLLDALGRGKLSVGTRARIALAVAAVNGCSYCLSAHSYLGKNFAKLDEIELAANRAGRSGDARADAAVRFAVSVTEKRGHIDDAELAAVRDAGYSDAEIIEIVQHVALNSWTNYLNEVARTDIDFPVVAARLVA